MGMGPFSSDSATKTSVSTVNRDVQASDNAVVNQPIRSGNVKDSGNVTVRRGGTLTITNGIGSTELQNALGNTATAIAGSIAAVLAQNRDSGMSPAIAERVTDQVTNAPKEENRLGFTNWILIAAGGFALAVAILHRRK